MKKLLVLFSLICFVSVGQVKTYTFDKVQIDGENLVQEVVIEIDYYRDVPDKVSHVFVEINGERQFELFPYESERSISGKLVVNTLTSREELIDLEINSSEDVALFYNKSSGIYVFFKKDYIQQNYQLTIPNKRH